jgi:hypothetical protein
LFDQVVSEHAATLSEAEGVSAVDGQIVASHHETSFSETGDKPAAAVDQDDDDDEDLPPPPPPAAGDEDDLPPPPPAGGLDDDLLPPPASPGGGSTRSAASYAALVTPSGFVSPSTEASRRNFTNRYCTGNLRTC